MPSSPPVSTRSSPLKAPGSSPHQFDLPGEWVSPERFDGTIRRECPDRLLVFHRAQPKRSSANSSTPTTNIALCRSLGRQAPLAHQQRSSCVSAIRNQSSCDGATSSADSFTSTDSWRRLLGRVSRNLQDVRESTLGARFGDALLARPNTSRPISVSFIQWDTPARRILRSGGRWLVVARADVYGGSGIPAWRFTSCV
jgi:hypothetical protein